MKAPYNYSAPDWAPLEAAVVALGLPLETCGEFMWMCEDPAGVHQYKHRDTRQYAKLTAGSARTYQAMQAVRAAREVCGNCGTAVVVGRDTAGTQLCALCLTE